MVNKHSLKNNNGFLHTGCLVAIAVAVVVIVGAIAFSINKVRQLTHEFTDTEPLHFETITLSNEEQQSLEAKLAVFRKNIDNGTLASLLLSEKEVNTILAENASLQESGVRLQVDLEPNHVDGTISLPTDSFEWESLKGRYLNGKATFDVFQENGLLVVSLLTLEVNDRAIPEMFMNSIRRENLAQKFYEDAETAPMMQQIKTLEIGQDSLTIEIIVQQEGKEAI